MDFKPKDYKHNLEENASLLSKLFFTWVQPLIKIGNRRELTVNDVYSVREEDRAEILGDQCEGAWNKLTAIDTEGNQHCSSRSRSPIKLINTSDSPYRKTTSNAPSQWKLLGLLWSLHRKQYLFYGLLTVLLRVTFGIFPLVFLRLLTKSFLKSTPMTMKEITDEDPDHDSLRFYQYLYASGLCFSTLFFALIIHWLNYQFFHIGVKCSVGLSSLIYRKVLRLSVFGQTQTTVGQLINLIANDVRQFTGILHLTTSIVSVPIMVTTLTFLLWIELGAACFPAVGFLTIVGPCQYFLGIYAAKFRRSLAKRTDARAHTMSEIINGIRIIKMYVWEKPFAAFIHQLRLNEIKELRIRSYIRALIVGIFNTSSKVTAFITILTVYLTDENEITADKVFFAISSYHLMGDYMLLILPDSISMIAEIKVATNRIQAFLESEEKQCLQPFSKNGNESCPSPNMPANHEGGKILLQNASARWIPEKLTLENLNLELAGNKLFVVLGKVGSGKSSFLKVLLEELPLSEGNLEVCGRVSNVSQEPWIFNGSIRQNITFGASFEQNRYNKTIAICALATDIQQWPYGDLTVIGEKGITLSGGQKARIGLARVLYQREANIYLFDDPLSAVDSSVGGHIFNECISQHLAGRTRILVTHQLQYLPQADHIIVLDEGKILVQGTYEDILKEDIDLVEFLNEEAEDKKTREKSDKEWLPKTLTIGTDETSKKKTTSEEQLENEEKSASGSVSRQTYWKYVTSGKAPTLVVFIAVSFISLHGLVMTSNFWLAKWTNSVGEGDHRVSNNITDIESSEDGQVLSQETFAWTYAILTSAIATLFLTTSFTFYSYSMKIGTNLHDEMFRAVARAPMKFFDSTSSGRILNRFTRDLSSIDEQLPSAIYEIIEIFLKAITSLTIIMWSTPFMILPTAGVLAGMFVMRNYYVATSRSLKRIEAISRSPVFTFLNSTFQGLDTIRSLGGQNLVIQQFDAQLNIHTSSLILVAATNRWFSFWIQIMCAAYLFLATYGVLIISSSISSGTVGLAISSAMLLVSIQWALKQSAEAENLMTCVERVIEFIGLKSEAPTQTVLEHKPKQPWPLNGEISFENVSLSYNEDKTNAVLKQLSFHLKPNEKVGIIGRTGAGKSSIITALFRLQEIYEGNIFIDGVDIKNIGLDQLRDAITIIPQDPVLFSGSIRYNLDPFTQFEDIDIWAVLEQVDLKDFVGGALDYNVAAGGSNFSVGQRQLVCLARALLRQTKIIVLDEATSNCDVYTDLLIQTKLKEYFSTCTTLVIAHRIHTVMDSDKILVLDNGTLQEFGTPSDLLQNPDGYFSKMVQIAGLDSK